jgi:translation initiation factor 1
MAASAGKSRPAFVQRVPANRSVMRGLFIRWPPGIASIGHRRLLVLALFEQFQLSAQQQDLLLLQGQGIIERLYCVVLKGDMALHLHQLLPELINIHRHTILPWNPCIRIDNRLIYCRYHNKDTYSFMSKRKNTNSRLVYSTDAGRLCPQCHRPRAECVCGKDAPAGLVAGDGIVRLHRETKGRSGKAVTLVKGLPLAGDELKTLAKALKQKCGVGGALKDGNIEIQGDQRTLLKSELENRGFVVKIAGG